MEPLFELLQIATGARAGFEDPPSSEGEWNGLLKAASEHSLMGVTFPAVDRMRDSSGIPADVYMSWLVASKVIKEANARQLDVCSRLSDRFLEFGFRSCVLKGQAAGARYPDPLLRQCGDIDLWLEGDRRTVMDFLREHSKVRKVVYHHCDAKLVKDMKVEVHFTPSWMNSFRADRRLQRWFASVADEQFSHRVDGLGFCVPTLRFDGVFLLLHIYRHVLEEGIGLRQALDYQYLLVSLSEEDRKYVTDTLKELGLMRFAGEVMYVLREVFATPESALLCPPDTRGGARLLRGILRSGNFGNSDERNEHRKDEGLVAHGWRKVRRNLSLLPHYPSEVLAMPFFMIWQYLWRRRNGYLYKGR